MFFLFLSLFSQINADNDATNGCETDLVCTVVLNAASEATYSCTTTSNSRVSVCAAGYFKTIGGSSVADTCTECGNGVASYACSSGVYKSGTQCDGKLPFQCFFSPFCLSNIKIQPF